MNVNDNDCLLLAVLVQIGVMEGWFAPGYGLSYTFCNLGLGICRLLACILGRLFLLLTFTAPLVIHPTSLLQSRVPGQREPAKQAEIQCWTPKRLVWQSKAHQ